MTQIPALPVAKALFRRYECCTRLSGLVFRRPLRHTSFTPS